MPSRRVRVIAIAGAIVVVIAALGGFGTVPVQRVTLVGLGETVAGAEVELAVEQVRLVDELPGVAQVPGTELLVIEAQLENTGSAPTSLVGDRIRVIAGEAVDLVDEPTGVVDRRNGTVAAFLQPGLPTALSFTWRVPDQALPSGAEIVIGVFDRIPISNDPIYGDSAYTDPRPIARLVLELGDA